jgi:hypothetical protein
MIKRHPLRVKDKVEITGNIPFMLKDKPRPIMGTVTKVDGFLVMVKPKGCRWEVELLDNEVRLPGAPEFPDSKRVGRFTYIHPSTQIHSMEDLVKCADDNEAVYNSKIGGIKPARVFTAMSFSIVASCISKGYLYRIININPKYLR